MADSRTCDHRYWRWSWWRLAPHRTASICTQGQGHRARQQGSCRSLLQRWPFVRCTGVVRSVTPAQGPAGDVGLLCMEEPDLAPPMPEDEEPELEVEGDDEIEGDVGETVEWSALAWVRATAAVERHLNQWRRAQAAWRKLGGPQWDTSPGYRCQKHCDLAMRLMRPVGVGVAGRRCAGIGAGVAAVVEQRRLHRPRSGRAVHWGPMAAGSRWALPTRSHQAERQPAGPGMLGRSPEAR